jgi:hypothetical protein
MRGTAGYYCLQASTRLTSSRLFSSRWPSNPMRFITQDKQPLKLAWRRRLAVTALCRDARTHTSWRLCATPAQGTLRSSGRGRVDHCIILQYSFEVFSGSSKNIRGISKHEDILVHRNQTIDTALVIPPSITPHLHPAARQTLQINLSTLAFCYWCYNGNPASPPPAPPARLAAS